MLRVASQIAAGHMTPYYSTGAAGILLPAAMTLPSLQMWLKRGVPGSGTWTDATGNGNSGTLNGDAAWSGGRVELDGSGDYIDCGNSTNISNMSHLTLACDINITSISGSEQVIMGRGYNGAHVHFVMGFVTGTWSGFGAGFYDGSSWHYATTGSTLPTGTPLKLAATYDGNIIRVYVDGTKEANATVGAYGGGANSQSTLIGGGVWSGSPSRYIACSIGWAAIWNDDLTADQVAGLSGL